MADYDYNTRAAIDRKRREEREKKISRLPAADQQLARELTGSNQTRSSRLSSEIGRFYSDPALTPSKWFKSHRLMEAFVPKEYEESFLCIIDKLNQFPFSYGWMRRTVRTAAYGPSVREAFSLLTTYENLGYCGVSVEDYIYNRLDEEKLDYIKHNWRFNQDFNLIYAAEIDRGNEKVISALKDLILSENNTVYLNREMILGILRSDNKELQKLLNDLLLAARLQEGLRQAICESMDQGTKEAFADLLKTIEDHDLIRYSSVRRAVSTWIGIFDENSVDRITNKLLNLMGLCLRDPDLCREQLKTNDSVAISVALWALGFEEADRAVEAMMDLIENGTKNQKLTASYYNQSLFDEKLKLRTAKKVILECWEDLELVAAYLPAFSVPLYGWIRDALRDPDNVSSREEKPKKPAVTDYYSSRKEAEDLYDKFHAVYEKLPKKGLVYDPFIFPWYRAELTQAQIISQLAFLSYVLEDEEKKTAAAGLIGDMTGTYGRSSLITLLLYHPSNRKQKETLIKYMGLAEESASAKAISLVKKLPLESQDYRLMEDMLRFKKGTLRKELLALLMGQSEQDMAQCLKRLLEDKKEEKRSAALDLLLRLSKQEGKEAFYQKVKPLASLIQSPTDKETVLLKEILGENTSSAADERGFGLYDPDAPEEIPSVAWDKDDLKKCIPLPEREVVHKIKKLDSLIRQYKDYEYDSASGEKQLVGNSLWWIKDADIKGDNRYRLKNYPLEKELRAFYEEEIRDYGTFVEMEARMLLGNSQAYENGKKFYQAVFGKMPFKPEPYTVEYGKQLSEIRAIYRREFLDKKLLFSGGVQAALLLTPVLNRKNMVISYEYRDWRDRVAKSETCVSNLRFFDRLFEGLAYWETDQEFTKAFWAAWGIETKCKEDRERSQFVTGIRNMSGQGAGTMTPITPYWFLKAYHMGLVSKDIVYKAILNYFHRGKNLEALTQLVKGEYKKPANRRNWQCFFGEAMASEIMEKGADLVGPETWCGKLIKELYDAIMPVLVDIELRRGEAETEVSCDMSGITYIRGVEYLVRILMALGKDPLSRDAYYSWYYRSGNGKKEVLSRLLKACYPAQEDDGQTLAGALKGTSIKADRLVEVAMYAPQWIDVIQDYLGWKGLKSGCYYFMAHMNERFDDQRKAVIARYTPLEPEELQDGAFDIDWFRECYELLGEKNFSLLYKAAKYISDGQKHSRARKYADAATGKTSLEALEAEIKARRNKDLLMSYGLVPFGENRESDMVKRYQFIQNYSKEAKQFGAQRRASETKAAQIGLVNLSVHAGFADVTRLTLNMETRLIEEFKPYMQWKPVDDVELCLQVGEDGKSEILCRKQEKILKSVPSRLGKDPYVLEVKDAYKKLKEQYVRTKKLMEESMENGAWFTAAETAGLLKNPVVKAVLEPLVFAGEQGMGFVSAAEEGRGGDAPGPLPEEIKAGAGSAILPEETEAGTDFGREKIRLTSWDGESRILEGSEKIRIAHPLDFYKAGLWHEYQKILFDRQIRQPFKQVFRELYVKLSEEEDQTASRMFAGNQIQPQKTVGCLKSRRWVADYEEGLQKVYYKENIVARIYALADWFSPSDIEAPTLEWVEFSDRKTFRPLKIREVPELIYSEVMRDVDLAVSVAHAGGVDPETSHSTIEMRRAIVEFNLPLFGLKNVTLKDSHALIQGSRADYTVHLGSGVVHQKGGSMLHILPVHSQKRGKLFLPFVDEDPKTAEIMSKIVFLAEDKKIKDPTVLDQIM